MNKKVIRFIVLIIFIILSILLTIIIFQKENEYEQALLVEDDPYKINDEEINGKLEYVQTRSEYYMVKRAVENFYIESQNVLTFENYSLEKFYNLFDNAYTEAYKLTLDNIKEKAVDKDYTNIRIDSLYRAYYIDYPTHYFVKGIAINEEQKLKKDFLMIVVIDKYSEKCGIILEDYIKEYGYDSLELNSDVKLISKSVKNNSKYVSEYITEDVYVENMFNEFRKDCMYFPERAYDNLTEEMKRTKFQTYDSFVQYLNSNKKISLSTIGTYIFELNDGNGKYVVSTSDGEIYYFYTESVMNYKVQF